MSDTNANVTETRCAKSGCGALAIYAKPCTDFDCPQRFIDAASPKFIQALAEAEALGEANLREKNKDARTQEMMQAAARLSNGIATNKDLDQYRKDLLAAFESVAAQAEAKGVEKAAHAARLAMINDSNADELTCSICAREIRALMKENG